jgi:hypothetical protein
MGMDVFGRAPRSEVGKYFGNNIYWWRPLWNYCLDVAPLVAGKVKGGCMNDGDGLAEASALVLADMLAQEIEAGRTAAFEQERDALLAGMADEPCRVCGGTGKRLPPPDVGPGDRPCNGCFSKGTRRPRERYYAFSVDNVKTFVEFLRHSGGFEIH